MRYGQKHVVSLSSPFLISFGCFWSHFEGKPVWGWGWVSWVGVRVVPTTPRGTPALFPTLTYRVAINEITSTRDLNLRKHELQDDEWEIAENLRDSLKARMVL